MNKTPNSNSHNTDASINLQFAKLFVISKIVFHIVYFIHKGIQRKHYSCTQQFESQKHTISVQTVSTLYMKTLLFCLSFFSLVLSTPFFFFIFSLLLSIMSLADFRHQQFFFLKKKTYKIDKQRKQNKKKLTGADRTKKMRMHNYPCFSIIWAPKSIKL